MHKAGIFHRTGSWSFILLGAGHLLTYFLAPKTAEQTAMIGAMKGFAIDMAGTHTNLFMFYEGFSTAMGILLTAFGILNILLAFDNKPIPARILYFDALIALVTFVLSIFYFFIVPILFSAVAAIAFISAILTNKT